MEDEILFSQNQNLSCTYDFICSLRDKRRCYKY